MKNRFTQRRSRWWLSAAFVAAAALAIGACGGASDQQVIAGNQADGLANTERPDPSELSARELVIAAMNADFAESSRGSATTDGGEAGSATTEYEVDEHGNTRATTYQQLIPGDPDSLGMYELLLVDDALYMRISVPDGLLDESGSEIPDGWLPDGWMTAGRETMELFGISCGPPLPGSALDSEACAPPNDLSGMADFVLEAAIVGNEPVRGVETIRVRTALDFKSLMEAALGNDTDGSFLDLVIAMMPSEVPIELWVDDDLRVHRVSMDVTPNLEALEEELGEEIDEVPGTIIVMDFYDFGADIVIEAPPPGEIVGEFGEWLEKLGFPAVLNEDPISTV